MKERVVNKSYWIVLVTLSVQLKIFYWHVSQ